MTFIDIILLTALAGFVFYGLFFGLVRTVGSLAGLLAGVWAAVMFSEITADWLSNLFLGFTSFGRIVTFILIFTLVNRLVAFGFAMLDRSFNLLSIIPFLKTINRLAGLVFGLLEGALAIGLVLYVVRTQPILGTLLDRQIAGSQFAPYFLAFVAALQPILPEVMDKFKFILNR